MYQLIIHPHAQSLLADERLPLTRRPRVARELKVRLQAQLARDRRAHLAGVARRAGVPRPAELRLDEELRVEHARRAVERRARHARVDVVRGRDRVRHEQRDDLGRREARVSEAREERVGAVEGLGDEPVGRRCGGRCAS